MTRKCLLLSLLFLAEVLLVHFFVLQRFPNSGDEQAYLFQARLYARNQLYVEDSIYDRANPLERFIRADALDDVSGRRFPKYDPGWPLLLSVGSRLGAEWIVAPLLGAITVFLLLRYVGQRVGDQFIWPTWWLAVLCSFFVCSVANFGNHTAAMTCLFGAFVIFDGISGESGSVRTSWQLLAVGLLLACCSLIRYLDWIPLMAWIGFTLLRRRQIRGLAVVFLGFALLVWVHLVYNKIITGHALLPPAVHDARGNEQARIAIWWSSFEITAIRLFRVLYVFPPVFLLLFCLKRPLCSAKTKAFVSLFLLNVLIYLVYSWTPAGPGPRYYLPYFPFLFLAVIEAYRLHRGERSMRVGWRVALGSLLVCSLAYAAVQGLTIYRRLDLERSVARLADRKKVILVQTGTYKMDVADLIRNPIDLWSADTVYLDYQDGVGITELLNRFPDHHAYAYRYPGSLLPWPPPNPDR
jgi:hypothetical protein